MKKLQSVTKIMGKTATWTIFCFSPSFPFNNVDKNEQNLCQAMLWVHNIVWGGEGDF